MKQRSDEEYSEEEVESVRLRFYRMGYEDALKECCIWKNGVQLIGYPETPIKEVIARRFPDEKID